MVQLPSVGPVRQGRQLTKATVQPGAPFPQGDGAPARRKGTKVGRENRQTGKHEKARAQLAKARKALEDVQDDGQGEDSPAYRKANAAVVQAERALPWHRR